MSESLKALRKQMTDEEDRERHTCIAILGETLNELVLWKTRSRVECRTENSRIELIPDNWGVLISYLSRRIPLLALKGYKAGRELREAQVELNRWVVIPSDRRGGNTSLGVVYDNMNNRLEQAFETVNELLTDINGIT